MLPVALARSSCNGIAIRYVLPVLRITSCFHFMGPTGGIKQDVMFRRVYKVVVMSYDCSVWLRSSECGTGMKLPIYDCFVLPILYVYSYHLRRKHQSDLHGKTGTRYTPRVEREHLMFAKIRASPLQNTETFIGSSEGGHVDTSSRAEVIRSGESR